MAANTATQTRTAKKSPATPKTRTTAPRATKSARSPRSTGATAESAVTPDSLEHLLKTYRTAPDQVGEHGHAPIREFEGKFVEAGQRMVFLRSTDNAGAPKTRQAVFVHGLGGSARNWTDLMYLLSPVVGGIAPDLPGFGRSPMPVDRDYSQAAHAQTVIRLIEDRCTGPIDLFGNSMGGAIATRIAALRPDLVRSLVLVAPALPDLKPRLSVAPLLAMTTPVVADVAARFVNPDPEAAVDRMHNLCFLDVGRVHPERREVQVEETRWRMSRENAADPLRLSARSLGQAFLPGSSNYLWSLAEKVECPTLVIFGTHDKLVDPRLATRAARSFHNSRVTTLKTGHVAQMEDPVKVARLTLQMWAESHV